LPKVFEDYRSRSLIKFLCKLETQNLRLHPLFCDVTRRRLLVAYRRFGTLYATFLQGQGHKEKVFKKSTSWPATSMDKMSRNVGK